LSSGKNKVHKDIISLRSPGENNKDGINMSIINMHAEVPVSLMASKSNFRLVRIFELHRSCQTTTIPKFSTYHGNTITMIGILRAKQIVVYLFFL
jgi:hypothetical protein